GGGGGGEVFGGGVFGGSVVFSGDGVGNRVREVYVVRRRSAMGEVSRLSSKNWVPEKDRWYRTRGKFVRWKGVRVTKASKREKGEVRTEERVMREKKGEDYGKIDIRL
ncbi:hypothetical protein Tco_0484214, partial [Tanacetum coccineum]